MAGEARGGENATSSIPPYWPRRPVRLVVARGEMMETGRPGAMLAVFASPERVAKALSPYMEAVSIAAINGPTETVISGKQNVVDEICQSLATAGISCRALPVSYAFH